MLAAAEELRARKLVKRDSGVFGSISDERRGIFDSSVALDVLEMEVADFCKGLDAGVLGVAFEPEPTIGSFEKKDVRLFCFNDIVAILEVGGLFTKMQTRWFLFGLAVNKFSPLIRCIVRNGSDPMFSRPRVCAHSSYVGHKFKDSLCNISKIKHRIHLIYNLPSRSTHVFTTSNRSSIVKLKPRGRKQRNYEFQK